MTTDAGNQPETSMALLQDPGLRRQELDRVMSEHPILTHAGLGWVMLTGAGTGSSYRVFHRLPENDREQKAYGWERDLLVSEVMTPEERRALEDWKARGRNSPLGEIPLALRYLDARQHSDRREAHSGDVRRGAEVLTPGNQGRTHPSISNGAMIAAALMARVRVVPQDNGEGPGINARLRVAEPRKCSREECRELVPAGSRERICHRCRQEETPQAPPG